MGLPAHRLLVGVGGVSGRPKKGVKWRVCVDYMDLHA